MKRNSFSLELRRDAEIIFRKLHKSLIISDKIFLTFCFFVPITHPRDDFPFPENTKPKKSTMKTTTIPIEILEFLKLLAMYGFYSVEKPCLTAPDNVIHIAELVRLGYRVEREICRFAF